MLSDELGNSPFSAIAICAEILTPSSVLAYLVQFKLIISMRLHGLIFAKIAGVPYEGIVYDPKVKAFLEDKRSLSELKQAVTVNLINLSSLS